MGVHYFYTWVTRRYPLFKKNYDPEVIPSIDNFFIDLNGVLYKCAKDDKALYRDILKGKPMDEIFSLIYNYINFLVNHIRPRKRIYIAIDGVAPKAKMNNQRQRRYHSARANKSLNDFLTDELHTSQGIVSFKNNSITPGTEFMIELIRHIKFFIQRKIHEDDNWKNVEVIFSGGDVPGEGEHKIMNWIRGWKQSKDYDINESHCVYSLDADLIFLSMALHLPKILILRETMKFDSKKVNSATKRHHEEQEMELLFINLIREYMELEYAPLKNKFQHPYDLERIIDDFIFISFFIGNDFLHKLYCMSTKKGNFDEIIEIFKQTLPTLGDYLTNKGRINWGPFLVFLKKIRHLENKMIATTLEQMKEYITETQNSRASLFVEDDEADMDEEDSPPLLPHHVEKDKIIDPMEEGEIEPKRAEKLEEMYPEEDFEDDYDKDERRDKNLKKLDKNYELEYQLCYTKIKTEAGYIQNLLNIFQGKNEESKYQEKCKFYTKFFDLQQYTDEKRDEIICSYLKGLQFVMHYYFHGCPSWTWFYPYFMSPFLSDLIVTLENQPPGFKVEFEPSVPYKPFDQLAYILPKASLGLLPDIYAKVLLNDPLSARYYPDKMDDFEPFDGIHDYQWIAKLDLFNTTEMNQVLSKIDASMMTEQEWSRNRQGREEIYKYEPKERPIKVKSIIEGLPDFEESISVTTLDLKEMYPFEEEKISYSIEGSNLYDGFPSLFFIKDVRGELIDVRRRARYKRLMLEIHQGNDMNEQRGYKGYVFYDYPFKKIGYVNTIVDKKGVYNVGNLSSLAVNCVIRDKRPSGPHNTFIEVENDATNNLYKDKGIDFRPRGSSEIYYELEHRKSAWRTALDMKGKIIYEFGHVDEILPHSMLIPFTLEEMKKYETQFSFPINENDLFKPGSIALNLNNGDLVRISNRPVTINNAFADTVKLCPYNTRDLFEPKELVENQWKLLDTNLLREIGVQEKEVLIVFGIMDSLVIKTDQSKTSSLILGGMFDIGLRLFKALDQSDHRLMLVTDLVK